MKLKFKNQKFQLDAVDAVASLFKGQEHENATFSILKNFDGDQIKFADNHFGNKILIDDKQMLENMHAVQKRNLLRPTDDISEKKFCIEMETGTGKTYVYTRTIFELNKKYGFTKFIIVVPSVAIREGVYKSFQVTKEHFSLEYDNVPYRYFIYNSKKLTDIKRFADSSNIEIMIINIDAFKKSENIINQERDTLNGEMAINYIRSVNPIVIIDEPQSVDNTPKAKEAIASLNPLCSFRYSATHREKMNLLYRLTPVDAYHMGLVKQISAGNIAVENDYNNPYIKLIDVSYDKGFKAKIEMDVRNKEGITSRKTVTVKPGSDLYIKSGERELYKDYMIAGIDCTKGYERIEFSNSESLDLGHSIGDIDENIIKKGQIKDTIRKHLDKELSFLDKGIKVLSLFFIDEVKKYRTETGEKGIYAEMFEECYNQLISLPRYQRLRERFNYDISKIHNGYFSQDKKGNYKNTKGDTKDDDNTYNTIMKDKEWLLSFDCPLRFIFSHSALKEGWDNPNVFQVCTLIDQKSTFTCRQKIGRGLRLCVNQNGERIENRDINMLHVIANENFKDFADKLQKEIESETGVKFGTLEISMFTGQTYSIENKIEKTVSKPEAKTIVESLKNSGHIDESGHITEQAQKSLETNNIDIPIPPDIDVPKETIISVMKENKQISESSIENITYTKVEKAEKTIKYEDAKDIIELFESKGYITKAGKIKSNMKNTMKEALLNGNIDLPDRLKGAEQRCVEIIDNATKKVDVQDSSKDVLVHLNKRKMLSPEFTELWNKIKQKTTYRVNVNTDELIEQCIKKIKDMRRIPKSKIISQRAKINIKNSGIDYTTLGYDERVEDVDQNPISIPNAISILSEKCGIPALMCEKILLKSGRLRDLVNNPEMFIETVTNIVKELLCNFEIDGIRYVKLPGEEYYVQEIFPSNDIIANLDRNAVPTKNSVYDHVICDSTTIEKPFAIDLDNDPDVKMFFKIPDNFKIETPISAYNPDWAIYIEKDGVKKMYFVLETKGSLKESDRRATENMKIKCGREHFEALDNGTDFEVATSWREFKRKA